MDIDVQIDRLVLDGLDLGPGGADALAAALRAELTRSLAAAVGAGPHTRPTPVPAAGFPASANAARLVLPPVAVTAGMPPGLLGRRIGATLAGGLHHG
ncbi:hypothetical protein AL755_14965 [Arthrobacter sp. ERGS1:01]|uniref:hypothetical protein n=1 Tax=Arthrobacter sp. ERGS1:01 TaxID=1704044 RepID=UPI0006B4324A|nr:hypothetical protein [Arthrobacter sp. ERGS1:01]ALE06457.1 hypothetical protein AL755_14965 [Arthrobacter sp. ERGS1:01]